MSTVHYPSGDRSPYLQICWQVWPCTLPISPWSFMLVLIPGKVSNNRTITRVVPVLSRRNSQNAVLMTCTPSLTHLSLVWDWGLRSIDPRDDGDASLIPPDQLENRRRGGHPLLCTLSSRQGFDMCPTFAKLRWYVDFIAKPVYPRVWVCHTQHGRKPIPIVQVRI